MWFVRWTHRGANINKKNINKIIVVDIMYDKYGLNIALNCFQIPCNMNQYNAKLKSNNT